MLACNCVAFPASSSYCMTHTFALAHCTKPSSCSCRHAVKLLHTGLNVSIPCMKVQMRQEEDDVQYKVLARGEDALVSDDAAVLRDYFHAGTGLSELAQQWAKQDARFCNVHPYFPGMVQAASMPCFLSLSLQPCSKFIMHSVGR